jgi:hypothetical protein
MGSLFRFDLALHKACQVTRKKTEQTRQLSNASGPCFAVLSFLLKSGEPLVSLDFFRSFPFGEWLPTVEHFNRIIRILKERVEADLRSECVRSEIINLAVDGWSDPRGRRYQSVTARLVDPNTLAARTRLLAMKEIKSIHESSAELRGMLGRVQGQYALQGRILNVCTDRASMNESAFRQRLTNLSSIFDIPLLWLPCVCHLLNNILSFFFDKIRHRLKPIFHLQQRFRKCGPFLAYLVQQNCAITSIPSTSIVRWYSSNALFESLLVVWEHMKSFAEIENYTIPQLNDTVQNDIRRLRDLTAAFVAAQGDLESDNYATASRFVPYFLAIQKRIDKFQEDEPNVVQEVGEYITRLQNDYENEWDLLTLMTYLNPSLQWEVGRTCSDQRCVRIMEALMSLVQNQLEREPRENVADPGSDDFITFRPSTGVAMLTAFEQTQHYNAIRTHREQPLRFWSQCPVELKPMSIVAIKILSLLGTSASVERSFSIARRICSDYQMAMKQETIAARAMIQVNWCVAQPLLQDVLAMGRRGWARFSRERDQRRAEQDEPWRLNFSDEDEQASGSIDQNVIDQ